MLEEIGRCGRTSGRGKNLSRNFHAVLDRFQRRMNVTISTCQLTLRTGWPKLKPSQVHYPWISLTSWAKCLLQSEPRYLLGGLNDLSDLEALTVFTTFWDKYESSDPSHPVYQEFLPAERKFVIPICLHGDEGRGKNFHPTLVLSYQVVVHGRGLAYTNTSG